MKKFVLLILALCLLLCLAGCMSRKPSDSNPLPTWKPTESQQGEGNDPTDPSATSPTEGATAPTNPSTEPTTPTTTPTTEPTVPPTTPTTVPPTEAPTEPSGNSNEAVEEEGDIFIPLG